MPVARSTCTSSAVSPRSRGRRPPRAGVRDRRRRARSRRSRSAPSPSSPRPLRRRPAAVRGGVAGRRQPAGRRAQPRAGPAPRRRPRAQVGVWGSPSGARPGAVVAAGAAARGGRGRLLAAVHGAAPRATSRPSSTIWSRFMLGAFLWSGATQALSRRSSGPGCRRSWRARWPGRTLGVPDDLPAGRGHPPGAGGQAGSIVRSSPATAARSGIVNEEAVAAPPRTAGLGADRRPSPRRSSHGLHAAGRHRRRGAAAGDERAPARSTSCSSPTARSTACWSPRTSTAPSARRARLIGRRLRGMPTPTPDVRRCLVRRTPRTAARGGVGAADRPARAASTTLPRAGQAVLHQQGPTRARRADRRAGGLTVTSSSGGAEYLVLRPLLDEYVVSMPRGAAVVYPRTPRRSSRWPTSSPAPHVVEAGVGSGALTCSLLRAVGPDGRVSSYERREDFAEVARRNVTQFFGGDHPAWTLTVGDLADALPASSERRRPGRARHARALGVRRRRRRRARARAASCARTSPPPPSCSRFVETLRAHGGFTEPQAWESLVRELARRGSRRAPAALDERAHRVPRHRPPDGPGAAPPRKNRRPAPGAYGADYAGPRPAEFCRPDGRRRGVLEDRRRTP